MFISGNAFLNEKLHLWQVATLDLPPHSTDDWFERRERTHCYYIVFGESELLRDDNPEGRDTRADIKWWVNLMDGVQVLVPLLCGVVVFGLVYVAGGFGSSHRTRDEA